MKTRLMCSGRRYGSTDMQHDRFRSGYDLDLWSNFQNDPFQCHLIVNVSRQMEYDAGKMDVFFMPPSLLFKVKSYYRKPFSVKTAIFRVFSHWRIYH